MYFNEQEKAFINQINSGEISTIVDITNYLNHLNHITVTNNPGANFGGGETYIAHGAESYIINNDFENTYINTIITFYTLCEKLNKFGLINISNIPLRQKIIYYLKPTNDVGGVNVSANLNYYIHQNIAKMVLKTDELSEFIKNNYKRIDEIELELERKQRKNSEIWTRAIGIISILASIGTCIFGYITYSSQRDVYIKNEKLINEPISVEINNVDQIIEKLPQKN